METFAQETVAYLPATGHIWFCWKFVRCLPHATTLCAKRLPQLKNGGQKKVIYLFIYIFLLSHVRLHVTVLTQNLGLGRQGGEVPTAWSQDGYPQTAAHVLCCSLLWLPEQNE